VALTVASATAVVSSTSTTATTAAFTPAVGEVLVVLAAGGGTSSSSAVTLTASDSDGGTWTTRILSNLTAPGGSGGGAATAIFTRPVSSATSITVTVSGTTGVGSVNAMGLQVLRLAGTSISFGTATRGAESTSSITPSALTSTTAGSTLLVASAEWTGSAAMSSSDLTYLSYSNGNQEGGFGYKTLGAAGPQTFQETAAGSGGRWYWAALEVWDAGGGGGGGGGPLTVTSATPIVSSTSATVTTASFTPAAGETLLVLASGGATSTAAVSIAITDSQGASWTTLTQANAGSPGGPGRGGVAGIWTRAVTSATPMTITATASGGYPNAVGLQVYRLAGGSVQIGVATKASLAGSTINPTALTSTQTGSVMFVSMSEWRGGGITISSSDLAFTTWANINQEGGAGYKTLGSPGPQTFMASATGSGLWYYAAVEVWAFGGTGTGPPATTSSGGTASAGPRAFDSLRVEVEFTPGVRTDVTDRVRLPLSITQGRRTAFGDVDPATVVVELENYDGWMTPGNGWSPYAPNVGKGRTLWVTLTKGAKTYTRFCGIVQSWEIVFSGSTVGARAILKASDKLARVAQAKLRSNWTEAALRLAKAGAVKCDAWEATGAVTGFVANMTNYSTDAARGSAGSNYNSAWPTLSFGTDKDVSAGGIVTCSPDTNGDSCETVPRIQSGAKHVAWLVKMPTTIPGVGVTYYVGTVCQGAGTSPLFSLGMEPNGSGGSQMNVYDSGFGFAAVVLDPVPQGQWVLIQCVQNGVTPSRTDFTATALGSGASGSASNVAIDVRNATALDWPRGSGDAAASAMGGFIALGQTTGPGVAEASPTGAQGTLSTRLDELTATCSSLPVTFTKVGTLTTPVSTGLWSDRSALDVAREMMRSTSGIVWARPRDSQIMLIGSDVTYPGARLCTFDMDGDLAGPPKMQDTSDTKPTRVDVQYPGGTETVIDTVAEAPPFGEFRSITVTTVVTTAAAARAVGQTLLSREAAAGMRIPQVTLDLATSVTDWTDVLFDESTTLGGLFPTVKVGISAYPEVFGRSVFDVFVQGWTETYGLNNTASITFDLSSAGDVPGVAPGVAGSALAAAVAGGLSRTRSRTPQPVLVDATSLGNEPPARPGVRVPAPAGGPERATWRVPVPLVTNAAKWTTP